MSPDALSYLRGLFREVLEEQAPGLSFTPKEEWERLLDETLVVGGWLVQEWVESQPYLYQNGAEGAALHSVIWGTFCLGGRYGGGFLRMSPKGRGDGVINSARGATEGYLFEV